ncbi:MAG: hypothetical protein KDI44_14230 [Thiothrix sp.]|nr:hypothetical protein [Thiothrix sp.]HPQ94959.1 hypothetical protein [Thiolinea sp.]
MTVQIELPQIITLLLAFAGLLGGGIKLLLTGFRHDLRRLEEKAKTDTDGWRRLERELLELRADLPNQYVKREDYVRGQTVIEAKLDALYQRLELVQLRVVAGVSRKVGNTNEH